MKKIILIFMTVLLMASITATAITAIWSRDRPQILLDNNSLTISQERGRIAVYDVSGDVTYTFHIRHKNASKRLTEPYTAIDTPTLRIEKQYKKIILYVKRSEEIYTLSISRIFPNISLKLGVNE